MTSLSGGKTTALNNNPLTSGVGFCWCNCKVERPSAHNWPVRRSSWCGKHDCRASVPNNPSDPILATTQHILHCSPGKTTFKLIRPTTVNGDESAYTSRRVHGLNLSLTCGCTLHISSKTDVANIHLTTGIDHELHFHIVRPSREEPRCRGTHHAHHNRVFILGIFRTFGY